MRGIFFKFLLTLSALLYIHCGHYQNHFDVKGSWYLIRQDSIYEENIFIQDSVWAYDFNFGEMKYVYKLENDSLRFISLNGDVTMTYKLLSLNNNEFVLKGKYFDLHYHRLKAKVDIDKLFASEEKTFHQYVNELEKRKFLWKKGNIKTYEN